MLRSFCSSMPSLAAWLLILALPVDSVAQTPMDQTVKIQIEDQLRSDIRLRETSLDIDVMAGQVTLQGELPSFFERNRVERVCRQISGVEKVINRITVVPVREGDQGLRDAVMRRLEADPVSRSSNVNVDADGTIVTLRGTVPSLYDRRRVQWLTEQVRGVTSVRNELVLGSSDGVASVVADEQIAAAIRGLLGKDQRSIGEFLQVTVRDGVVTLEGEVESNGRRRFYRYLVERLDGVRDVDNQLEVRPTVPGKEDESPTIDDAALDIQLALDAAGLAPQQLRAQVANGQIAIVGSAVSLSQGQQIVRLAQAFASGYPILNETVVDVDGRTVDQLRSELSGLLRSDVLLADASVEVAVEDRTAILTGRVDRFTDKLRAERLASSVPGIGSIKNELVVDWMATVSDEALRTTIRERLERDRRTADVGDAIQIQVKAGRVTLTGNVSSEELRRQIGLVVAGTDGIRSVDNQIVMD